MKTTDKPDFSGDAERCAECHEYVVCGNCVARKDYRGLTIALVCRGCAKGTEGVDYRELVYSGIVA